MPDNYDNIGYKLKTMPTKSGKLKLHGICCELRGVKSLPLPAAGTTSLDEPWRTAAASKADLR